MAERPKTVKGILESGAAFLGQRGVEHPRLACELLASRLLKCKRLELYLQYDAVLDEKRLDAMRRGVMRVGAGEPIQYVLGETEFMGHRLKTDARALIPRPETEQLVELVLQHVPEREERQLMVDVGTGSGCIAISLALARPAALLIGVDTSEEALSLARENADLNGVAERVAFTDSDLADCIEPESADAVVANLPYIPTAQWERLPVHIREHEPRAALDGGGDGLDVIKLLVADSVFILRSGGYLFLEVDESHAAKVAELMRASGFSDVEVRRDLADKDRFVWGRMVM